MAAAAAETTGSGSGLRQRAAHAFAEEEEALRVDQEDSADAPATAEQAAPAAEEDNGAAAALAAARAADEADAAIDPVLGEGADDNGVRGQLYFIFKVLFLLFMFFGDGESYHGDGDAEGGSDVQTLDLDSMEAQRMLKIFGIATMCYLCVGRCRRLSGSVDHPFFLPNPSF